MQAWMDKATREILRHGMIVGDPTDANTALVEVPESEVPKFLQIGKKTLSTSNIITVTPVPLPPEPVPVDYGNDAADISLRAQVEDSVKLFRDYLASPPHPLTPDKQEAVLRALIRSHLALMRAYVRTTR